MKVVCVLKSGGDFHVKDVCNLKTMLERNITIPYEFYCLTDMFTFLNGVYVRPLKFDYVGWWSKIELFRPGLFESERIVYFDLDTIILNNIDDLLLQEDDFIGLRPFNPTRAKRKRYLGSGVLGWKNDGSFDFLFKEFRYAHYRGMLWGDQDYISLKLGHHNIKFNYWQERVSGIYSYKRHVLGSGLPADARIVCFHGVPRPHQVKTDWVQNAIA